MTEELIYEDVPAEHRLKYMQLGLDHIGMCIVDLAMVLQQGGIREDNRAKIGGIVMGLQQAALYIDGKRNAR